MRITTKTLLGLILLCLCINVSFASTAGPSFTKGFYVNNFKEILGDKDKETELLQFAAEHGYNYLLLYNLNYIHNNLYDLTNRDGSKVLADFIKKAKTRYGIAEIGMVGEKAASFAWVNDYQENYGYKANYRIDVYHLEFEFWNQNLIDNYYCAAYLEEEALNCTTAGAFEFYQRELKQIREMTVSHNLRCETYIGNPTTEQCAWIGRSCDRVLVHYYRKSDVYNDGNSIYQFKEYRIPALAPISGTIAILPIFSAGSTFMGPWLSTNPEEKAFTTYNSGEAGYDEQEGDWKNQVVIEGYQWYRYSDLQFYLENSSNFNASNSGGLNSSGIQLRTAANRSIPAKSRHALSPLIGFTSPQPQGSSSPSAQVYPNPANQWMSLATQGEEITRIEVYQTNGILFRVYDGKALETSQIDVSTWPEGRLIIRYYDGKTPKVKQLIIKHE